MTRLKDTYKNEIVPALKEELGKKNVAEVPAMVKVTINSGLSTKRDAKFIENILSTLRAISGQEPVKTKARLSESGFKIREGMVIGAKVTLRGPRMWDFSEKLVQAIFPRVRDFRGIDDKAVDSAGNFNYGFREHTAFPEIPADEIESLHGLQVTITTTATSQEEGLKLFKALGFPFKSAVKKSN